MNPSKSNPSTRKILFLCIGNDMRGDDAIGPVIAKKLSNIFKKRGDIVVINTGIVPENYTGVIRREDPSHIIIIDAVDMEEEPGHIKFVEKEEIANYNISTHAMPLSFLINYLESSMNVNVILIGIQPQAMNMVQSAQKKNSISGEAEKGIEKLLKMLQEVL